MAYFWSGYELKNFLFEGFNIDTPEGFAGVFISFVSISICYEGIRSLRDFVYQRFLDSKRESVIASSKQNPCAAVRYSKNGNIEGDEAERESLTRNDNGGGDGPVNMPSTSLGSPQGNDISQDDDTGMDSDENGTKGKRRLVTSSSPYRDTTTSIPDTKETSRRRRQRELMDLSISSLLHMIYITIGYVLMLAVMTWDVLIFVAVVMGIGIGFCFFGVLRNNGEFTIFKCFNTGDPSDETLLGSHNRSKTTESSSAGSGSGASGHCVDGGGDTDIRQPRNNEFVTGVQVHASQLDPSA